jgi:hypothetical protein
MPSVRVPGIKAEIWTQEHQDMKQALTATSGSSPQETEFNLCWRLPISFLCGLCFMEVVNTGIIAQVTKLVQFT